MRTCKFCEKDFPRKGKQVFCSYKCRDANRYYKDKEKRLAKDRKRYGEMTPEQVKIRAALAKERHPLKHKARQTLRNAITAGKIKRLPCEICGKEPTHAHHTDYTKALFVRWLCVQHHYEQHRKYKQTVSPKPT